MLTAYIGMGGNVASVVGAPETTLAAAAERLERLGRVSCRSSLYSTEPMGYAEQARFVNAVVALETELEPHALLDGLLAIEQEFGRDRTASVTNGPRTLDLDILIFGDLEIDEPGLVIPHPRLAERAFVLVPLLEVLSAGGKTRKAASVKQLLQKLPKRVGSRSDAVVPIESTVWRAGAVGSGLPPRAG